MGGCGNIGCRGLVQEGDPKRLADQQRPTRQGLRRARRGRHERLPEGLQAADTVCDYFFDEYSLYAWDGYGKNELQRILNLYEHHENYGHSVVCFTPTRNYTFNYPDWPDPYGNSFTGYSRVFAADASLGATINLTPETMCYCLDSYLALGYDYIADNPMYYEEFPVNWVIADTVISYPLHKHPTNMHLLTVQYGKPINDGPGTGQEPGPGSE